MPVSGISIYGRDTQGVILMRVEEENRVISLQSTEAASEETEETKE